MVRRRKIIWLDSAQNDRKEIFKYWNNRNKSNNYSKKLNKLFIEKTEFLKYFPWRGKLTNKENVRVLVIKNHLIFYEVSPKFILILRIWEGHQNPENLEIDI